MGTLIHDIRFAFRSLLKQPMFAAVAIITLALGIGANTAIFSIVNAVLLRPLPYQAANELVMIWGNFLKLNMERLPSKAAEYNDYSTQNEVFDAVAAYESLDFNLTGGDQPERIRASRITPNLFSLLGVQPGVGRSFTRAEVEPGQETVAILSHGFWQRHFFGNKDVISQEITIDDRNYRIVGIMPEDFEFPYSHHQVMAADVFVPLPFSSEQVARRRGPYYLNVLGRLKEGVTLAQARVHMSALAQRLEREQSGYRGPNGEDGGWRITVVPLQEEVVGGSRRALLVLLGAVGLVLLIGCANLANLLLLRAAKRRKELAIRSALGATRWQIVQQLLIEGLLLTAIGGVVGVLVARWAVDLLATLGSTQLPRANEVNIDGRVLLFTAGTAAFSSILLSIVPALQTSKVELQTFLKGGSERSMWRQNPWNNLLVVSEVALSLLLLIGAGLLINSFLRLQRTNTGVVVDQLMTAEINLPGARYPDTAQATGFYHELTQRLEALPGVQAASTSTQQPLSGSIQNDPFSIEGRPLNPADLTSAGWQVVGANYFQTLGIPILKGRDITEQDLHQSSQLVAIINEKMAARFWPNEDPIGRRVTLGLPRPENPWITIVGIAKDLPHRLDLQAEPNWYLSRSASLQPNRFILVRGTGNLSELINAIRGAVQSIDRNQPVSSFRTMTEVVNRTIAPRKFNTFLLGIFAAVALGLAALGTYSVISYSVALRTQEIAIRMALGAGKPDILKLVLKRGMEPALMGALIGLLGAFALSRLMTSMLFEVTATDPLTYVLVLLFSLAIALIACYVPARRATRVDPLVALRFE